MSRLIFLCAVGWAIQTAGASDFGFLYSDGLFTTIQDPLNNPTRMTGTSIRGINDAGLMVGSDFQRAFFYSGGTFTTLSDPAAVSGSEWFPAGINNAGDVVGVAFTPGIQDGFHGFLYHNGAFTRLDDPLATGFGNPSGPTAINDVGQIVGFFFDPTGVHGFLDTNGSFATVDHPLGHGTTQVYGINDSGEMIGTYFNLTTRTTHAFLYANGNFTDVDAPGAPSGSTQLTGINNAGQIVGWSAHSFIYSGGTFTQIDDPLGTGGTQAYDINNRGQIVGGYNVQLVSPEPSSAALFLLGLFGACVMRNWSKRARRH